MNTLARHNSRRGFTLAELLVVITIIGVLAALISAAAVQAVRAAKETAIISEIKQLEGALKVYKADFGEFPPSDFQTDDGKTAIARHLRKRFPRIDTTELASIRDLGLTEAQALVFWLRGFSSNVVFPTQGNPIPLFEFERTRLRAVSGSDVPVYVPPGLSAPVGARQPYVYFNARSYGTSSYEYTTGKSKKPYMVDETFDGNAPANSTDPEDYMNPDSCQILSAGLDNDWGEPPDGSSPGNAGFPVGDGYEQGDLDNLVNFSPRNLGKSKE